MKKYLYSDLRGNWGWFKNPADYRKSFPMAGVAIRCAHPDIEAPKGWHKPNGYLANDGIERIQTMRNLVAAL